MTPDLTPRQMYWIETWDAAYDAEACMVVTTFHSPGYHTRVASGTPVHQVVTAFEYAMLLLATGEAARLDRVEAVLDAVLKLQDTVPTHATYGIWPYLLEEPLDQMKPQDWNWADFSGARIAGILREHTDRLTPELVTRLKSALGHAAMAIFRRNVTPGYTNIAIMGAGVCAAAGELLDNPLLLDYGRQRLQDCVTHAQYHGTLTEYNSPAYTPLALHETERILQLISDPGVRDSAEALRRISWIIIADHFHPGTQQWTGPHARTYNDQLDDEFVKDLAERTGAPLAGNGIPSQMLWCGPIDLTVKHRPCPSDLTARFQHLPEDPLELRQCVNRRAVERNSVYATTWMTEDACLGSVSRDNFWYQRRPVLAYWKNGERPAVLRLRFLCDDRDFCSAYLWSAQKGTRVLTAASLIAGLGYYALHMDVPPGGIFEASDFRLRWHLLADGAEAENFQLRAGGWAGNIFPAESQFGEFPVQWESGQAKDEAWVDGICYQGPRRAFDFSVFGDVRIACGMELRRAGQSADIPSLKWTSVDTAAWNDLAVTTALQPQPYLWASTE